MTSATRAPPARQPRLGRLKGLVMPVLVGVLIVPVAFGLIATGPRYVPAPEVALLLLLQTVLGALWVWMAVGEAPHGATWREA